MLDVQEKLYTIMLFSSSETNIGFFHDMLTEFNTQGYIVFGVESAEDAKACLDSNNIDAILTTDEHSSLRFIKEMVASHLDTPHRPILCIFTNNNIPPSHTELTDIVSPYIPIPFITRQIRHQLEQRQILIHAKQHQDELELLKNAIVRNVSHELKTPLLQVKSAVALITEDDPEDKLSRMAIQATARLETIVKNITLLADSMNGNFGPILVSESLNQATRNLRRIWAHKNAESRIQIELENSLPPVMGDKQGLGIVLQQLIDNALKFSNENVIVRAEKHPDGIQISVIDYGIGIAADKIKQIFESFYQIDSSSTRRYGGTGVGLAIVRLIMEKHNVEITVESKLGVGSSFSFVLPEAIL